MWERGETNQMEMSFRFVVGSAGLKIILQFCKRISPEVVVSQDVAVKHFSRKCDLMTKRNLTFTNTAFSYQKVFEKPRVIYLVRHNNHRAKKNIFKSTKMC